jgi:hypothetical protein
MGILSGIALLPLTPVRAVVKLGEVIQRQAEEQLYSPANTRRQLEELQEARERGEISDEEEAQAQEEILQARIAPKGPPATASENG